MVNQDKLFREHIYDVWNNYLFDLGYLYFKLTSTDTPRQINGKVIGRKKINGKVVVSYYITG